MTAINMLRYCLAVSTLLMFMSANFDGLDKRWEQPAIWQRLSRMIEVPPEFTEVVYVYRNAADPEKMEWKELLLSDFRTRFDGIPLKECLATRCFDDIFRP